MDMKGFISKVEITREGGCDCEFEVTEEAMNSYLKYPCYSSSLGWGKNKYQNSIHCYMRDNKKTEKASSSYKGAYLLQNMIDTDYVLTADILTSIITPVKSAKAIGDKKIVMGIEIREYILKDHSINPYIRAFAEVYYWCGNMMPVISNYRGREIWQDKMWSIKECFQNSNSSRENQQDNLSSQLKKWLGPKILWSLWIQEYWNGKTMDNFVQENYLQDMYANMESNLGKYDDNWFLVNTKLIIQRSYRIINGMTAGSANEKLNMNEQDEINESLYRKEWHKINEKYWGEKNKEFDKTNREIVTEIFKEVFINRAGILENSRTDLLDLFY